MSVFQVLPDVITDTFFFLLPPDKLCLFFFFSLRVISHAFLLTDYGATVGFLEATGNTNYFFDTPTTFRY